MSFGTINIAKKKEEESKPRQLDLSIRVAVIGPDKCGKTSFKDRFCFSHWSGHRGQAAEGGKGEEEEAEEAEAGRDHAAAPGSRRV